MIVLNEFKILQKLMGLNPLGGLENIIMRFVHVIAFLSSDVMIAVYFIFNAHDDIIQALGSSNAFFALASHLVTCTHLWMHREEFYSLLDELQDIVTESTKLKNLQ